MMKYVWMFHEWYDMRGELVRFWLLLVISLPIITMGLWAGSPLKFLLALVYFGALLLSRAHYLERKKSSV